MPDIFLSPQQQLAVSTSLQRAAGEIDKTVDRLKAAFLVAIVIPEEGLRGAVRDFMRDIDAAKPDMLAGDFTAARTAFARTEETLSTLARDESALSGKIATILGNTIPPLKDNLEERVRQIADAGNIFRLARPAAAC